MVMTAVCVRMDEGEGLNESVTSSSRVSYRTLFSVACFAPFHSRHFFGSFSVLLDMFNLPWHTTIKQQERINNQGLRFRLIINRIE
jgi:hypothetical protein